MSLTPTSPMTDERNPQSTESTSVLPTLPRPPQVSFTSASDSGSTDPVAPLSPIRAYLNARGSGRIADNTFQAVMLLCALSIFLIVIFIFFILISRSKLSLAVGKRSLNCGFGKRSSKLSPIEACELAASVPAFGARPHCARTNDSGTNVARTAIQRHRAEPTGRRGACRRAQRAAPGASTGLTRSDVWNLPPTIHPLPQKSTGDRRMSAR